MVKLSISFVCGSCFDTTFFHSSFEDELFYQPILTPFQKRFEVRREQELLSFASRPEPDLFQATHAPPAEEGRPPRSRSPRRAHRRHARRRRRPPLLPEPGPGRQQVAEVRSARNEQQARRQVPHLRQRVFQEEQDDQAYDERPR